MIVVHVYLHAALQYRTPQGPVNRLNIRLPEDALVKHVLTSLGVQNPVDSLLLMINHRVVDENTPLNNNDRLDIIPAGAGV